MIPNDTCPHRQRFLRRKRKRCFQQYGLAFYLVGLIVALLCLQVTIGDSLICPVVTYVLVSSFIVLVCVTNNGCCSAKRTIHKPLPRCLSSSEILMHVTPPPKQAPHEWSLWNSKQQPPQPPTNVIFIDIENDLDQLTTKLIY